jgi:alkylhydroperoxidase family enzyme
VNDEPASVTRASVDAVKAAGWSERALVDAATVCSVFNFFNRWVDAAGVPDVPGDWYDRHMAAHGTLDYTI